MERFFRHLSIALKLSLVQFRIDLDIWPILVRIVMVKLAPVLIPSLNKISCHCEITLYYLDCYMVIHITIRSAGISFPASGHEN